MCVVPKRCNDMMNVGRLQGFDVRHISLTLFAKVCECVDGKLKSQPLTVVLYVHKLAGILFTNFFFLFSTSELIKPNMTVNFCHFVKRV